MTQYIAGTLEKIGLLKMDFLGLINLSILGQALKNVEATTGSPMRPGTLYGALARLERRGLIEALEQQDRRRPYRLTALGATTLQVQLDHLRAFAQSGLKRLGRAPS